MLTRQDEENYGPELLDLTRRAAAEVVSPQLAQLRQENAQLRGMAQRSQRAEIERALNQAIPHWRAIYETPAFSTWLESPDDFSATTRSQLLRNAVAAGDASRVIAIYRGFERSGYHAPTTQQRAASSRPSAGGKPIYSRQQIADYYKRRQAGLIDDATWARREADIIAAGREGRVIGAIGPDGTELSRWA
jgi:hypothetical protein